jgi:hypothetical protein
MGKLTKVEGDARDTTGAVKGRLIQVSERYDQAYQRYAKVIAAAKQEARDEQAVTDIVVGIAIGIAVGLLFEAFLAGAAVGAAAKGISAALKSAAKKAPAVTIAVSEGVEAAAGKAADASGAKTVEGTDLEPGGLKPEILKMEIWKGLTKLHESAPQIGGASLSTGLLMANAEYAIGEIKAHSSGGKAADQSADEDAQLVLDILSAGTSLSDLDKKIDAFSEKLAAVKAAAQGNVDYSVDQMEKDIWLLWMASLPKDSNILDIDAIENHIGPDGLGLVDFGWYTSDDDEDEAIAAAEAKAAEIRQRRNEAVNVGGAGPDLGNQ